MFQMPLLVYCNLHVAVNDANNMALNGLVLNKKLAGK
jgi:hypothetical protein